MPNAWIDALKKWNEGKGMWCLPKKGTKDYDEVKALMAPKAAAPKKEAKAKAPKAEKAEAPLPKIAEKVTREELMSMLESYTEERRRLSSVKGAKLAKGMSRIDKLEDQVKEKIKEMDAAAKPKERRSIKVKGAKEKGAQIELETAEDVARYTSGMTGEERAKVISEYLAKVSAKKKTEEAKAPAPPPVAKPTAEEIALFRVHNRRGGDREEIKRLKEKYPEWDFLRNQAKSRTKQSAAEARRQAIIARRANKKRDS